ncbi:MAG: hypothetical protein H6739_20125 [Alphaproteobacteria bacterium]|nr:hypothetical protein [Alphaproteobacteria bacterium]
MPASPSTTANTPPYPLRLRLLAGALTVGWGALLLWWFGALHALGWIPWDGEAPIVCDGRTHLKLSDVRAALPAGPVIEARGHCRLTLEDCDIRGPTAVALSDNAHVVLRGCEVTGDTALTLSGDAEVTLEDAEVSGAVAVVAADRSVVRLRSGRISGARISVDLLGDAILVHQGGDVLGRVRTADSPRAYHD